MSGPTILTNASYQLTCKESCCALFVTALYCVRAGLRDGQDVLELGCGWGSLSLFVARAYPNSRVTAVSNSTTQKAYIDGQAREMGLKNLTIITADMVEFQVMGGLLQRMWRAHLNWCVDPGR